MSCPEDQLVLAAQKLEAVIHVTLLRDGFGVTLDSLRENCGWHWGHVSDYGSAPEVAPAHATFGRSFGAQIKRFLNIVCEDRTSKNKTCEQRVLPMVPGYFPGFLNITAEDMIQKR